MAPVFGLSRYGVATAAGVEALKPRSVITIDWSIIFRRFYEKFRAKITLYPSFFLNRLFYPGSRGELSSCYQNPSGEFRNLYSLFKKMPCTGALPDFIISSEEVTG